MWHTSHALHGLTSWPLIATTSVAAPRPSAPWSTILARAPVAPLAPLGLPTMAMIFTGSLLSSSVSLVVVLPMSFPVVPMSFPFPPVPVPVQLHIWYRAVARRHPSISGRQGDKDPGYPGARHVVPWAVVSAGPVPASAERTPPVPVIEEDIHVDSGYEIDIGARYGIYLGRSGRRICRRVEERSPRVHRLG